LTAKKDDQASDPPSLGPKEEADSRLPAPWALAMAVLAMLSLGVLIGSVTRHLSENAGFTTVLVEAAEQAEEEAEEPVTAAAETPEPETTGGDAAIPTATASTIPTEVPLIEEPLPETPKPEVPLVEEELPTGLPGVKHVFLIVLPEGSYEETFGKASKSPFLSRELPEQGELLSNYYAVTKGVLANQIALFSGQGPTPATAAGCPTYGDVLPATESPEGQVEGDGCAYPATTKTVFGQLAEAKLAWKSYREGTEGCPNPPPDAANPLLFFHAIADGPECAETNVDLPQLATDLQAPADKFPALAYLSPAPETPADKFLELTVPEIKESLAYKDGGMIAITFAQAPQEGEGADESGCCLALDFPNLPDAGSEAPATGPVHEHGGGGRVGLLLLSPYVEPGTTSEAYLNHFSLLITIEELFELERIGYAAEPALTGFDESIFNAAG
jgi:phosphatidylinositol-3-phosphatase